MAPLNYTWILWLPGLPSAWRAKESDVMISLDHCLSIALSSLCAKKVGSQTGDLRKVSGMAAKIEQSCREVRHYLRAHG